MLPNTSLISCNYSALPSIPLETPKCRALPCRSLVRRNCNLIPAISFLETVGPCISKPTISSVGRRGFHICRSTSNSKHTDGTGEAGDGGGGVEGRDWTTSFLLFVLWAGLMYYVFNLSPNQTPSRDRYFLEKLLNLKGDDGFRMNEVLVSLWYIMGLWPLVYSMLLLPTGRRYLSVFYRFFQHVTTIYHSVFTMSLILWNKLIRLSIVFLNNHIYLILQFPSLLLPQPSNAAITSVCLLELISFFLVGHCEVLSV